MTHVLKSWNTPLRVFVTQTGYCNLSAHLLFNVDRPAKFKRLGWQELWPSLVHRISVRCRRIWCNLKGQLDLNVYVAVLISIHKHLPRSKDSQMTKQFQELLLPAYYSSQGIKSISGDSAAPITYSFPLWHDMKLISAVSTDSETREWQTVKVAEGG